MIAAHEKTIVDTLDLATTNWGKQKLGESMLKLFLQRYPETAAVFKGTPISGFSVIKFRLISEHILDSIRRPEYATQNMFTEIYRHRYFDLYDADYYYGLIDAFRDILKEAMQQAWTSEVNGHWIDVVQASKATIQNAFRESMLANS